MEMCYLFTEATLQCDVWYLSLSLVFVIPRQNYKGVVLFFVP